MRGAKSWFGALLVIVAWFALIHLVERVDGRIERCSIVRCS
jgi:hypothetical protein